MEGQIRVPMSVILSNAPSFSGMPYDNLEDLEKGGSASRSMLHGNILLRAADAAAQVVKLVYTLL